MMTYYLLSLLFCMVICRGEHLCKEEQLYTKVFFPKSVSPSYPRLELDGTLPRTLYEMTSCMWLRPMSYNKSYDIILSYTHPEGSNDEMALDFNTFDTRVARVRFYVQNKHAITYCSNVYVGNWYHLCLAWSSVSASFESFLDGVSCGKGSIPSELKIRHGGKLIIAQDQDTFGGNFDASQAFVGELSQLHIWDEVLTSQLIYDLSRCNRKKFVGNVFAWMVTPTVAKDGIVMSSTLLCH